MNLDYFINQLIKIVSLNNIILDDQIKIKFEVDWRKNFTGKSLAVLFPVNITQIQDIILLCNQFKVAIVPQGGNTSLCGGATPIENSRLQQIIVNMSKLNKILEINSINRTVTVESGCLLGKLKSVLSEQNLFFPLALGSLDSCQIGGNIATNAGGINVLRYGMMRDLVLGLEVVLPNGKIINVLNELIKHNTYIDIKHLFIGSEGTLGIITKACLKIYSNLKNSQSGMIYLNNFSEAINLLLVLEHYDLTAFEIINSETICLLNKYFSEYSLSTKYEWVIMFNLDVDIEFDYEMLLKKLNTVPNIEIFLSYNEESKNKIWHSRELIPLAEKQEGSIIKHDISLPLDRIEFFIATNKLNILNHFPLSKFIVFGHLGDGNLHYNIKIDNYTKTIAKKINDLVYADVMKLDGSYSAEHGIGMLKKDLFKNFSDQNNFQLCKDIKGLIDPNNIFNRGKIFDD